MQLNLKLKGENKIYSNQKGITLIVLVVTIVVLIILAAITISAVFDDGGIMDKAKEAEGKMNEGIQRDKDEVNTLANMLKSYTEEPKVTDSSLKSDDRTTDSQTVIVKDEKGNQVVVPGGFKIAVDSGDTVEKGVVIEDKEGNQFVWIPVSNINNDGSNKIIRDDGTEVEITLGRYTFATTTPGTPTLVQKGSENAAVTAANVTDGTVNTDYKIEKFYELSDKNRISNEKDDTTATNTTAKDLDAFITKTKANKGFYIARYEASYGSGYNENGTTTAEKYENAKPLSKVSTACSTSSMDYTPGTLWNFISQPQAAIVSKNMYNGNSYVESDLINSYAWDTAIVYIQAMGNTNYANKAGGNGTLKNTGKTEEQACNIYDMAGNMFEFTTEYSTSKDSSNAKPCVSRGGCFVNSVYYTSFAVSDRATENDIEYSFRPILYVK